MVVKNVQIYGVHRKMKNGFASQKIESRHFYYPEEKLSRRSLPSIARQR